MDSWRDVNYLTANRTLWVQFMNDSTQDLGIGYLPPNIYAILGSLNDSYTFPDDALVVEHAGATHFKRASEIEYSLFGIISGIVILFLILSIIWNLRIGGYKPERSTAVNDILNAADFMHTLNTKYYERSDTEVELYNRDDPYHHVGGRLSDNRIDAEQVEAVTALLRKMYGLDVEAWAKNGSRETDKQELRNIEARSDAAWAEVRGTINQWNNSNRETLRPGERDHFNGIVGFVSQIRPQRYDSR